MKLKQTTIVNDDESYYSNGGDVFVLLAEAQRFIGSVADNAGPHWIQDREDFLHHLKCLQLTGRMSIFSFKEQLNVKVKWDWVESEEHELVDHCDSVLDHAVLQQVYRDLIPTAVTSVVEDEIDWDNLSKFINDEWLSAPSKLVTLCKEQGTVLATIIRDTGKDLTVYQTMAGDKIYLMQVDSITYYTVTRGYAIWYWDVWANKSKGTKGLPLPF